MKKTHKTFCFVVLAYNHEKYIIEHLESIRYLIENYGEPYEVSIIVNDDSSTDETLSLTRRWLSQNKNLFYSVDVIFNELNIGTCKSLCNVFKKISDDYCKITAGDDVYSLENIFDLSEYIDKYDIVSGIPIRLIDGKLKNNNLEVFNTIASSLLFDNKQIFQMTNFINFINAPNAIYSVKYLKDRRIIDFLSGFDLVEDWPIQIFISDINIESKFFLVNKTFVYYRRTSGSSYLVGSSRVNSDVLSIYEYLLKRSNQVFQKALIINRRYCFLLRHKYTRKILNFTLYIYFIRVFFRIKKIYQYYNSFSVDINRFSAHLELLKIRSTDYSRYISKQ